MLAHPLFRTLLSQPDLVVEHAGAYVELAGAELGDVGRRLRLRWIWTLVAGVAAAIALALGALALMLLCVIPVAQMPWPWGLAVLPGVPAGVALAAGVGARRIQAPLDFPLLREQWSVDRKILSAARAL